MCLFYAALWFSLGSLLFVVALIGCRNPEPPKWAGEFFIGNIVTPSICALLFLGLAELVQFVFQVYSKGLDGRELGLTAGVVAGSVVCYKLLNVKKTLARYANVEDTPVPPTTMLATLRAEQ